MYRVLKPGGRLMVLEFSTPRVPALEKIYDLYSFKAIPKIGKLVTGDEDSYQYLVESIRKHPDQETLLEMMFDAGFDEARYHNLSGGIVALHLGFKF
jgi:demethylmenaquinone methyltransferase/2-methoxy-6-polyprenyl-1,4-benzoquinol methylase